MTNYRILFAAVVLLGAVLPIFLLTGCQSGTSTTPIKNQSENKNTTPNGSPATVNFSFDFSKSSQDWKAAFCDYPAGQEDLYELHSDWLVLPNPLAGMGLYISGINHSDDLFMFIKRKVSGLAPNTQYLLSFDIKIATDVPKGCFGVGGPPGEGVALKAGASTEEPIPVLQGRYCRLNVDQGHQGNEGKNALILGNITNTSTDCHNSRWEIKYLSSSPRVLIATSDNVGSLWIFLGTDSGFEGQTSIYYVYAAIQATPN
jgi:hypothetical protein